MPRYTLKSLLIAVTVMGIGIGVLRGCYLELTYFETAENVPRVNWLPDSASNVSYFRSYSYTAYEFDMSEDGFKKWVRSDVKPITKPVQVYRYSIRTKDYDLGPNPTPAVEKAWEAIQYATVADGIYYNYRTGSCGGVTVAYDREKGRVFFQTNPR